MGRIKTREQILKLWLKAYRESKKLSFSSSNKILAIGEMRGYQNVLGWGSAKIEEELIKLKLIKSL